MNKFRSEKTILILALFASIGINGIDVHSQSLIQRAKVRVLEADMSYLFTEHNSDTVVVLLHGNPTQAYMWRNIIPYLSPIIGCVAPDLIGMGESSKLPKTVSDRYTFLSHERYLTEFLNKVINPNKKIILVGHDWGGVLVQAFARKKSISYCWYCDYGNIFGATLYRSST